MRQKLWKLPNFKIKPFLRKLKDDPRCQCESDVSALEYISVMLNMDQESRDNDGNKSDMRPRSKFRGRGIKFHYLQPHIFFSFYVKHSRQVKHDYILLQIDPKFSSWKGLEQIWFYPQMNGNKYHLDLLILQWGRRGLENKYYLTRYNGKLKFNVTLGIWSTCPEILQKNYF